MNLIVLSPLDLSIAALLILALAAVTWLRGLQLAGPLLIAACRTVLQLSLVGMILKWVFSHAAPGWIAAMAAIMLAVAGHELMRRQKRKFAGWWGYGVGAVSMFLSSFSVTLYALLAVVVADPWYQPQYAIPLLGMLLGNTMNGIALGLDRLTSEAWQQRQIIEGRLSLGESWSSAIQDIQRESLRASLTPIINTMSIIGVVSLPGMMTGQILSGAAPDEAVKYQIMIMFLIAAGTGFGSLAAISLGARRLFDHRQRLRLDRLISK